MRVNESGFTLVEMMVVTGLMSVIALAVAQIHVMSIRSSQSTAASDEFNSEISSLVNLVNETKQIPGLPNQNGCTSAFFGMPVPVAPPSVPIISPSQALLPASTALTAFNAYINSGVAAIALYRNRAAATGPIIQVRAPTITSSNANFPAPLNNIWVTNLYFKQWIDTAFIPAPTSQPTWVSNLYLLHVDAQKVGLGTSSGGPTVYKKEILVTLWTDPTNTVVYCGGNPI